MVVNGFELPTAFVQFCEAIRRGEAPDVWELKKDVDAYGHPWHVVDLRIIWDPERMQEFTDIISEGFLDEGRFEHDFEEPLEQGRREPPPGGWPGAPGFIEDFTGVANFIMFADTTSGYPLGFDFGADPKEPSVVTWDQYWRRVAPNFTAFMALFVPERLDPAPRELLRGWALKYVLDPGEENRPLSQLLPGVYAHVSPEERHRVEAEVREELERRGMTDDQRRALDELWARLHGTHRSN
jgi:hypothetical protein